MRILTQIGIVLGVCLVGELVAQVLPFPFPSSVIAMVLLFLLLLLVAHMVRQRRHRSRAGNRHYAARSSRHNRYR